MRRLLESLPQASMKVGQQRLHLRLTESPRKARHHTLAGQHHAADVGISRRSAAGQNRTPEYSMEIGRNLLQCEVIVIVAMSAAPLVKVLPFYLLRREPGRFVAARKNHSCGKQGCCSNKRTKFQRC